MPNGAFFHFAALHQGKEQRQCVRRMTLVRQERVPGQTTPWQLTRKAFMGIRKTKLAMSYTGAGVASHSPGIVCPGARRNIV